MGLFSKRDILSTPPAPAEPPTRVMETNSKFRVQQPQVPVQEAVPQQQIDPRSDMIEEYSSTYGDLFSPQDFVGGEAGRAVFYAEVCKLLFAVQNEIRELKEEIKTLK